MESFDKREQSQFDAAVSIFRPKTVEALINYTYNLPRFTLISDFSTPNAIGVSHILNRKQVMSLDEMASTDFAKIGKELMQSGKGITTPYCRVSRSTADQLNSYARQIRVYTDLIKRNPGWQLVEIFADEGITGTSAAKRPEFQRMLKMCEQKQIDLIITKSISRFARNTMEALEIVRRLKILGIAVQFEKEGIYTLSLGDEMLLNTFTAILSVFDLCHITYPYFVGLRNRKLLTKQIFHPFLILEVQLFCSCPYTEQTMAVHDLRHCIR